MSEDKVVPPEDGEMLPEYDLSGKVGVRGMYYQRMRDGYTIHVNQSDGTTLIQHVIKPEGTITLDPDVHMYFRDAEAVNAALRALIQLIPEKKRRAKTARTSAKRLNR